MTTGYPRQSCSPNDGFPRTHRCANRGSCFDLLHRARRSFEFRKHSAADVPRDLAGTRSTTGSCRAQQPMSPAGIAMFYAALGRGYSTNGNGGWQSLGRSQTDLRHMEEHTDIRILDLTAVPRRLPSMFSLPRSPAGSSSLPTQVRQGCADASRTRRQEHIDYVPAQIVTEFFRHGVTSDDLQGLEGIVYPSAQQPGGRSMVIFASQDDLDPNRRNEQGGPLLSLEPKSMVRLR